jgi:alpha-D-ribose 1-methylphosphonate 5-triphosphate diphosphatase
MILTNAQIILKDEVVSGTLEIIEGVIHSVSHGTSSTLGAIDCNNSYLSAGMIELHTDNMEKYFTPRPGVVWPATSAFKAHDSQMISAGITTVYDAISVGDVVQGSDRLLNLRKMVQALTDSQNRTYTRADHLLHLRCEVSHQQTLENFNALSEEFNPQLVSLMDHSPGQRQFADIAKYRQYYQGKYSLSDQEMEAFITRQCEASRLYSDEYRQKICDYCTQHNIPLASHDDATQEHVLESLRYNMTIAEFPTTQVAATIAHQRGMKVLMGAPNVIRGGSHSGNIAAHQLATENVLDILSSDYYPHSLLDAAFLIAKRADNSYDLAKAMRLVTSNPAQAVGLDDRGSIEAGKIADIVISHEDDDHINIEHVYKQGKRVF